MSLREKKTKAIKNKFLLSYINNFCICNVILDLFISDTRPLFHRTP